MYTSHSSCGSKRSTYTVHLGHKLCLVCLALVTVQVWQPAAGSMASSSACNYGTCPGVFIPKEKPGQRWQLLRRDCKLQNLVDKYGGNNTAVNHLPPPMSVLFLSDSMDRILLQSFCDAFNGTANKVQDHSTFNYCFKHTTSPLQLAQVYVPTFTPTNLVTLTNFPPFPGYKARLRWAQEKWKKRYPGGEPQLVVLGGGLWDIQRWLDSPPAYLHPIEHMNGGDHARVSRELLLWWMNTVNETIHYTKRLFPKSRLVWRTYAMPSYDLNTGRAAVYVLGNKEVLARVRAAGRAAAENSGLEVVDIEQMVQGFSRPSDYLQDHHHGRPQLYIEVLNVLLNIMLPGWRS